jgi:hypothetical protein
MNLKFTAYSRNERKIYSSGSDPVKITLDGKCIHTITGEELELGFEDWSGKFADILPSEEILNDRINDILKSQYCADISSKSQYFKGYKACFNWIHRIVSKLD